MCNREDNRPDRNNYGQWWHFSKYKTSLGNIYSGTHCPECSRKIYDENSSKAP